MHLECIPLSVGWCSNCNNKRHEASPPDQIVVHHDLLDQQLYDNAITEQIDILDDETVECPDGIVDLKAVNSIGDCDVLLRTGK